MKAVHKSIRNPSPIGVEAQMTIDHSARRRRSTLRRWIGLVVILLVLAGGAFFMYVSNILHRDDLNVELISAIKSGRSADVRSLLDRGADPNFCDPGETPPEPLWQRAWRLLIEEPKQSSNARRALYIAVRNGSVESARLLIDRGAPLHDQYERYGASLISAGCLSNNPEMVGMLLDCGLRATDGPYNEPLVTAVAWNRPDIVRMLVAHEADLKTKIGVPTGPGSRTADVSLLRYARTYRYGQVVSILKQAGAPE